MCDSTLAVISDIHGNRWALEAILQDIECRKIRHVVNLGDCVYGPLDPSGTATILMDLDILTVRGNEDRILFEPFGDSERSPSLNYTRESLRPEQLQWLKLLEKTTTAYENFLLCHGTPERDDAYLLQEVSEQCITVRTAGEVEERVREVTQPAVLCGHDHIPRTVNLLDGRIVVNPGSVGLPAYRDDRPYPHVMETGTPHARYSLVKRVEAAWRVENIAVSYAWETAAEVARENGRPDWADWLKTGRAMLPHP